MNKKIFFELVSEFSMTSRERIDCLYESLEYIRNNNINGDLVECGVWKGGNILGMLEYINYHKMTDIIVWAYDTFEGMTKPENVDIDLNGNSANLILNQVLCKSPLDEFMSTVKKSLISSSNLRIIQGDVNQSLLIDSNLPKKISLLRLDTDWYKSTKIEMEKLYPILENRGILIVDDYGHWRGSKMAIDEYFIDKKVTINKIDYTGIKIIKDENI